jgi:glutamate 5-kinase
MDSESLKRKDHLKNVSKIVVKIGSSTLTHGSGLLNLERMDMLVRQLTALHNRGYDIILVTSGAVGAGMGKLGLKERPKSIPEKQAAAAVGQGILLHMYEKLFSEYGVTIAQLLLTKEDMLIEERSENIKNTFNALLKQHILPIINENDAVAVDELKFGDNDTLSAMLSSLINADLLILLSDIDGLFDKNPHLFSEAKLIKRVASIDEEIENACGGSDSKLGTGGMITKVNAAKIVLSASAAMVIVDGSIKDVLISVMDGLSIGTWFQSNNL